MKIVLACLKNHFGDETQGFSYEYVSFYQPLVDMGHEVQLFDYLPLLKRHGKDKMNQMLLDLVKKMQPDFAMFTLCEGEFTEEVLASLRAETKTLCFFHDDTWRVEFSRYWAQHFDYFTTPDIYGVQKYQEVGLPNAIYFPFGSNEQVYKKNLFPPKFQ